MSKKNIKPKLKTVKQKEVAAQNKPVRSYRRLFEFLIIFILCFITYGNSIKNDYNIDDGYVVSLDNANKLTEKGIRGIPEMLTSKYSEGEGVTYGYRPLGKVTMAIEYSLWGNNPQYSHTINILLYVLNVFLLLLFFQKIAELFNYKKENLIYLSILFFIIHPIHTEVVCSIKNREEILCFSFLLGAVLLYFKFTENKKWWSLLLFLIFTFLAFLSKETAFNIFGILLLISFYKAFILITDKLEISTLLKNMFPRRTVLIIAAAFTGFLFFNKLASSIPLGDDIGFHFEQNPYHFSPASLSIPNGLQTIFFYVKKLCIPFPLLFYYGYDMLPLQHWASLYTLFRILILIITLFLLWYGIIKRKELFLIFWILFFLITLFPFSNMLYSYNVTGIVGERLIYQASSGFCITLACLIFLIVDKISQLTNFNTIKDKLPYYISCLIVLPLLILTINRNTQWMNKTTLYEHDIKYLSKSARANFMIAGHIMNGIKNNNYNLQNDQDIQRAVMFMNNAISVYKKYDEAWLGLGNIYASYLSMTDSALFCYKQVDTTNKIAYSKALEGIGNVYYFDSSNLHKALDYYYMGINKYPQNRKLYYRMTQLLFSNKMFDSLMTFADIGIKNNWEEGYVNKGDAFLNNSDTTKAMLNYQKAVDLGFREPRLLRNMSYYYRSRGQLDMLRKLPN